MSRTRIILLAAAAAAVAVAVTATLVLSGDDGPRRGAGPYVLLVYEVEARDGQAITHARDAAIRGIRERIDARGVAWSSVGAAGEARVQVEVGGEDVPVDRLIDIIGRRAELGIHRVDHEHAGMRELTRQARVDAPAGIEVRDDAWMGPHGDSHTEHFLWAEDRSALEAWVVSRGPALALGTDRRVVYERVEPFGTTPVHWRAHVIESAAIIDGGDVVKARVLPDPITQQPQVELELGADGRQRFAEATAAALGRKLAIVLDGRVRSAPIVQSPIPGGRIVVTMGGADPAAQEREAHDLVAVLRAGSLPRLRLVERRDVGPAR